MDLDITGFKKGFQSALKELGVFQDKTATLGDKVNAVGKTMSSVGGNLTKWVTTPLVGLGTAAMSVGNEFESAMSRVQAISGATGDELEALTDQALQLGADTSFSASEAAAGMENLASAGFTVTEIMDAMPGLLDLAASSGADLADATEIAASAIRGFGLDASDAGHVADVFAEAAARTNAQTEDMGEAMKYIAPVAKAMGQSLEETAAAIGIMSDAGIKGSQAGTSLRGALSSLARPSGPAADAMEELGLAFYDAQGNMLPLSGIVEELETKLGGLTQEERNNALVTIFGQESLSGILALMERGSGELVTLSQSFEDCTGSANAMAETMLDNTSGSIEALMGSVETLAIRVQQVLAPVITNIVQGITEFVNWLGSLDEGVLQTIITLAGIAAVVGPLLITIGKVVSAVGTIITVVTKLIPIVKAAGTAIKGLMAALSANPVTIVVAAIAALVAGFIYLWNNCEEFREFWINLWENIKSIVSNAVTAVVAFFSGLGESFMNAWNGVVEFFSNLWTNIKTGFSNFINSVVVFFQNLPTNIANFFTQAYQSALQWAANMLTVAVQAGTNFLTSVIEWFNQLPYQIGYALGYAIATVVQWAVQLWTAGVDAGTKFVTAVIEWFQQLPTNIANFTAQAWALVIEWASNMWSTAIEMGSQFISNVVSFFSQLPGRVSSFLSQVISVVVSWAANMASQAIRAGQTFLTNVVNFFQQLPSRIATFLTQVISRLATWVVQMGQKGIEAIQSLGNNIMSAAKALPGMVYEIGTSIIQGVWKGIQGAASWFMNQITGFFSGIVDGVKGALGINSPSKVMAAEVGYWMPRGVAEGFKSALPAALNTMKNALSKGVSVIGEGSSISGSFVSLTDAMKTAYENTYVWFEDLNQRFLMSFDDMYNQLQALIMLQRSFAYSSTGIPTGSTGNAAVQTGATSGGNTFIFNSPEAISPTKAAKLLKQTSKQLSLGM